MDSNYYNGSLISADVGFGFDANGDFKVLQQADSPADCYDAVTLDTMWMPRDWWRNLSKSLGETLEDISSLAETMGEDVAEAKLDAELRAKKLVDECTHLPPDQRTEISKPHFSAVDGESEVAA